MTTQSSDTFVSISVLKHKALNSIGVYNITLLCICLIKYPFTMSYWNNLQTLCIYEVLKRCYMNGYMCTRVCGYTCMHARILEYVHQCALTCVSLVTALRNWNFLFQCHTGIIWRVTWAHPEFGQVIATCSHDRTTGIWEELRKLGCEPLKTPVKGGFVTGW